ncbi:MAG: NnrS family protein [Rhodospirillales bacterium]
MTTESPLSIKPPQGMGRGDRLPTVFAAGFRLFFLAAGVYAVVATGLWVYAWQGGIALSPAWHGHEMIFGFAAAAIAGFLLTAVPNWTGRPSLRGMPLLGLGLVWLVGRVAMLMDTLAWLDLLFLPVLAIVVGRDIVSARNSRNYGVLFIVLALAGLNLLFHVGDELTVLWAATFLIVALIALIGGRIVPAFTQNALRASGETKAVCSTPPLVQRLAVPSVVVVVAAQILLPETHVAGVAALVAAAILGFGMTGWRSWATRRMPIVWILHAGYVWVPIGLFLVALADLTGVIQPTRALHALTANAIGIMVLAVASRAALGHSGRPLRVGRATVVAYVLVIAGGLLRVVGPAETIVAAGLLWAAGYAVFTAAYWPVLTRPRVDGLPG